MGRVTEKIKLTNVFDPAKTVEIDALIDTGATMVVLPLSLVEELGLRRITERTVRYGNGETEVKSIYGVVMAEMKGRRADVDVLAEPKVTQALVGQVLLELLDLVVDPRTRSVTPNPRSPDMPMVEVMSAAPRGP